MALTWRHVRLGCAAALAWALGAARVHAAEFYVAPDGDDAHPGTLAQPFASVERAQMAAGPGDTVYLRGGVYRFSGTQASVGAAFTKSGAEGRPIRYFAYAGETPIFDLFALKPQARVTGLDVHCNWVHLRGIEVRGVQQLIVGDSWSVRIRGDHNVIEQLNVHDGQAPGIFITSGASNLILNCDSHHNYDPLEGGGNADGFGCHSSGGDNVLRGCRAFENSDDGFDFINAPGTCTVEGSWAFRNGFVPDTSMAIGNGAGFKSGGFGEPPTIPASGVPRHVVRANLAFGNRAIGFYANHHPGAIDFLNNTAFDNPVNFNMLTSGSAANLRLRNNLAAGTGQVIANLSAGSDSANAWTLPVQVSKADFVSMDKALALMPRKADGTLPEVSLMHLSADSDLIDRGEDVGLPFAGKAPDLGAFEWGATPPVDLDAGARDAASGEPRDASASSAEGGAAATPDASLPSTPARGDDAAPPAREPANDASEPAMVRPDASEVAGGGPAKEADGCGCRVGCAPRDSRRWSAALIFSALGILAFRRSRRGK